ncbi:hypothetical protein ACLI4Z_07935 [Natrialbaceae archaeon A-arb3/5]
MPANEFARRIVLGGVALGGIAPLVGWGATADDGSTASSTTLERRRPIDGEISVEPGSTVLFEAALPTSVEPGVVEWTGDGESGTGPVLDVDYVHATGTPSTFRTFDSPGEYVVTATYQDGNEQLTVEWVVDVADGGASRPAIELAIDPDADGRIGVDDPIELTASSSDESAAVDRIIWVEGQNLTVYDVSDLDGSQDSATLSLERPGWISAGYPTNVVAVSETGVLSERQSVEGPEIRPPLEIDIVETNEPVPAGETLSVTAEVENVGDMMMIGDPTQELDLVVGHDPTVVDTATVSPAWSETEQVTLSFETHPVERDETFPVRVEGADDSAERTVTVTGRDEGGIDVSITGTNAPVEAGERLTVSARVDNQTTGTVTQDVSLVVGHDPQRADSTSVTLAAGDERTVTLGYETYPAAQTTEFPIVVETDGESAQHSVTVFGTNGVNE